MHRGAKFSRVFAHMPLLSCVRVRLSVRTLLCHAG